VKTYHALERNPTIAPLWQKCGEKNMKEKKGKNSMSSNNDVNTNTSRPVTADHTCTSEVRACRYVCIISFTHYNTHL